MVSKKKKAQNRAKYVELMRKNNPAEMYLEWNKKKKKMDDGLGGK
jgi:hypothetical protein